MLLQAPATVVTTVFGTLQGEYNAMAQAGTARLPG